MTRDLQPAPQRAPVTAPRARLPDESHETDEDHEAWQPDDRIFDPVRRRVAETDTRANVPPTGDSSNAMRFVPFEVEWPLAGVGRVKVQIRMEASFKRKGELRAREETKDGRKVHVGIGDKQAILENKYGDRVIAASAKINNSLVKAGETLLDGGDLTLAGVAVALKVEAKFLDANLGLDELKLDAAKISVIGEGDFTSLVPELVGNANLLAQIRLEVAIKSELVHDLYKLQRAADELKRGVEIDLKLNEAKRGLANREKRVAKLKARTGTLSRLDAERLRVLESEIAEIKGKREALQHLRAGAIKGRPGAIKVVKELGQKFAKTKLGSVVSRWAAQAVAMVFKKVIPVYNVVSTAIDLIQIAEHIVKASSTQLGNSTGGGEVGGTSQAEQQGTGTGSGAGSGAGSGGSGEAPTGSDTGVGAADDDDALDTPMPDLTLQGLEPTGTVRLTPAADTALKTLVKQTPHAPGRALQDEEKDIINKVIPADLDAEELAQLEKLIGAKSGIPMPIPQLVIEAMQQIRPDGKKVVRAPVRAPVGAQPAPRSRRARASRGAGRTPDFLIIDLEAYVADHAQIDLSSRAVKFPSEIEIRGVKLKLVGAAERLVLRAGDDAHWVRATFEVELVRDGTPRIFNDGSKVIRGMTTTVNVKMTPDA